MAIDTDFHNHVSYTSADKMVQTAKHKGLRVLGLSEHVFQMRQARPVLPHMPQEGPDLSFATYIAAVQEAAERYHFDVRLGLEVDFIPQKNAAIQAAIKGYPWDYLIGSVHEVDGILFERVNAPEREQGEVLWLRYFDLLRQAVCSGYFSVVSHPVRMYTMNPHLPSTFDQELEQLAAEAARCNVALEINGSDVLEYPAVVHRLIAACALYRTPMSCGSDAHYPIKIAQAHQQSETILREAGIRKIRIWRQQEAEEYEV
jgi:histidinol-phosphatase (PHP family)